MPLNLSQELQQAAQLARAGNSQEAKKIVASVLRSDNNNADAWYLAAYLTDDSTRKIQALERVLSIDPGHTKAQQALEKLRPAIDPLDSVLSEELDDDVTDEEVAVARSKSYTSSAVIVLVLYFVLFVPGLIANHLYLKEAEEAEIIAGQALPGVGALRSLQLLGYFLGVLVIIALAIIIFSPVFFRF